MRGVIFDADGTLIDSMPVWDNVCSDYIKGLGITPKDDLEQVVMTKSFADSCEYCIKYYGINKTADSMIKEISDMVADKYRNQVQLKTGVLEYIKALSSDGVKMCVVTASERGYITDCLKRLGVYRYMDFIMTCSEEKLDKNSAAIYDRAVKRLGVLKSETVVFEDAFNAVVAAKKGGYRVFGVYDKTMDSYRRLITENCDRYIFNFTELI